jgi:hypothetical protein
MNASRKHSILAVCALVAVPTPALANVGVPWLSSYLAYSVLLLIPIVCVETYVLTRESKVRIWKSLGTTTCTNFASTLLGVCIVLVVAGVGGVGPPDGTVSDTVTLLLLYPFYRLSVWVESAIGLKLLRAYDRDSVRWAIRLANRYSYALMATFIVTRIVKSRIVNGYFV